MRFIHYFIIYCFIFLYPAITLSDSLHLLFVDVNNTNSLDIYLDHLRLNLEKGDMIVIFDSRTSEPMIPDICIKKASEKKRLKKELLSQVKLLRDKYFEFRNNELKKRIVINQIGREERDVARMLYTAHNYIRVFQSSFKLISIVFFGESFIHNAYNHDFSKGIPTDGFIYLNESEFNSFPDMKSLHHEFRIFYDREPFNAQGLLRFYDILLNKKFGVQISSFNSSSALNSKPKVDNTNSFFRDTLKIISEKNDTECGIPDKMIKNYAFQNTVLNVTIINPCRANSIISFQHDNEVYQVSVDANGKADKSFHLSAGRNIIKYKGLKLNEWITVIDEQIEPRPDKLEYYLDESINMVSIEGYNPLRIDGSFVHLEYVNTGAVYNLEVKDGRFNKQIQVVPGSNVFKTREIDGSITTKKIVYSTQCSDKIEYDESNLNKYGLLSITLKNSCREDGSLVKFIYNSNFFETTVQNDMAEIQILLYNKINDIFYIDYDKNTKKIGSFKIMDFQDIIRFEIVYKDNVKVLANVFESGVVPPDPPYGIDYMNPKEFREGHLHVANVKSSKGLFIKYETPLDNLYIENLDQKYTQIYASRKKNHVKGQIFFYIDYFSRHGTVYMSNGKQYPPLCGKRSLGGVIVEYKILSNGIIESGRKFLNPSKCKQIEHREKPVAGLDDFMTFIKKVECK